ncbi:hypothetical protein SAMN05216411_10743 [Nitrosospira multiformis]|nr:hypothetical protein SAMN05216411_10743 [Nitrosospira multiformis]
MYAQGHIVRGDTTTLFVEYSLLSGLQQFFTVPAATLWSCQQSYGSFLSPLKKQDTGIVLRGENGRLTLATGDTDTKILAGLIVNLIP